MTNEDDEDEIKEKMWQLYKIYNKKQTTPQKTTIKVGKEGSKFPKYTGLDFSNNPDWKLSSKSQAKNNFEIWECTKVNVKLGDFIILADNYYAEKAKRLAPHNFYFGKYMALSFIDSINSGNKQKLNAFSQDLVRYAMSNIDDVSTYFWKIS